MDPSDEAWNNSQMQTRGCDATSDGTIMYQRVPERKQNFRMRFPTPPFVGILALFPGRTPGRGDASAPVIAVWRQIRPHFFWIFSCDVRRRGLPGALRLELLRGGGAAAAPW